MKKVKKAEKHTLYDLLHFIENKINALPHGIKEIDKTRNSLQRLSARARKELDNKDYSDACWTFFYIGKTYKVLSKSGLKQIFHKSKAEIQALEFQKTKVNIGESLIYTKAYVQATKEYAEEIAKELWNLDITNNISLDSMSEHVCEMLKIENLEIETNLSHLDQNERELFTYLKNAVPDDVNEIIEWLKPVAPSYARKDRKTKKG